MNEIEVELSIRATDDSIEDIDGRLEELENLVKAQAQTIKLHTHNAEVLANNQVALLSLLADVTNNKIKQIKVKGSHIKVKVRKGNEQ